MKHYRQIISLVSLFFIVNLPFAQACPEHAAADESAAHTAKSSEALKPWEAPMPAPPNAAGRTVAIKLHSHCESTGDGQALSTSDLEQCALDKRAADELVKTTKK